MLNWFHLRWNEFIDFLGACILTVQDMLKDVFFFGVESFLSLLLHVLSLLSGLLSSIDVVGYASMLPDEVQNVLALSGVNEALSTLITAIGIRLLLQLVPFTRLGS